MSRDADRVELLGLLGEIGRLELDLLVRDQPAALALQTLAALHAELRTLLERATRARRRIRGRLAELERELDRVWPSFRAAEVLRILAGTRRELVELDAALRPSQVLFEEVSRRCSRRDPGAEQAVGPEPQADAGPEPESP